ncbi:MAG: hypothetical protein ACHQ51_00650 [Elusimicrobiota bacterium]
MKSGKILLIAVIACSAAGRAAAQVELSAAYDSIQAGAKASAAKIVKTGTAGTRVAPATPNSCADAQELETSFEVTVSFANGTPARELEFRYAGCSEEGRNDYLPPYTERLYKGADGYELVVITNDAADESEVLLSKGKDWVGRFGAISNVGLAGGDPQIAGGVTVQESWGTVAGKATIRNSAKPQYAQLQACEAGDWSKTGTSAPARDAANKPATGWDGRGGPSLVLLTKSAAYYYYESCDICADIARCELTTGKVTEFAAAHSLGCGDLKTPRSQPDIVFDACAPSKP